MKHSPLLLVLASLLLLGGCATPLSVEKDSGRFSQTLGISAGDILFLNYCLFGKSPKGKEKKFKSIDGAVLATPTQVHLIEKSVQTNGEPQQVSLQYSEMQSVAHFTQGLGCQVHIEIADYIMVVSTIKKPFFDRDGCKTLTDLIAAKGVRVVEATTWYDYGTGGVAPIPLF